jgi:hypothetical protein
MRSAQGRASRSFLPDDPKSFFVLGAITVKALPRRRDGETPLTGEAIAIMAMFLVSHSGTASIY